MSATHKAERVGVRELAALKREGKPIVVVTAYDTGMARFADQVGVDLVLVGDSLGMTVLGYRTTIPVTLADCLHHTAAVVRGVQRAMVIADMPFLSYQISPEQALTNAGMLMQQAGADGVKLEGGEIMAPTVRRLVDCGVPVLGHIGILPQQVKTEGGYRVQGRTPEAADHLRRDAAALQAAGAFAVVLEGIPLTLSRDLSDMLDIPTIGIGAGPHCSGQVQVLHDILGLSEDHLPRHAKRYAHLGEAVRAALTAYSDEVRSGTFPGQEHSFT